MEEARRKLESYLDDLKRRGESLPSLPSADRPNFRAISAAAGLNYKHLYHRDCKQRISLAVRELGLSPNNPPISPLDRAFERNCALLSAYLKRLEEGGVKLPEDPAAQGRILLSQLATESGLNPAALRMKAIEPDDYTLRLHRMIESVASRLGTEVRILPASPLQEKQPLTYEQLKKRGAEARARELAKKPNARQQLYNTRSALSRFLKSLGLAGSAEVGDELVNNFKNALGKVAGEIKSPATRKKFQTEIGWWYDFYQRLLNAQPIPADFHRAIAYVVNRTGLPLSVLAKLIGASQASLRKWYRGESLPNAQSLPAISKMESLLKLPAGTLLKRIPDCALKRRFRTLQLPDFLRQDPILTGRVRPYLPDDFCELTLAKQVEIVESIKAEILQPDDHYTRRMIELFNYPYKLKEWPQRLEEEFNELAAFKTEERPPLGMKRLKKWRPKTKLKIRNDWSFLFGALRLAADAKDIELRGLGIPTEHLTLALLACPLVVDWYIRFRCEARTQYSEHPINTLNNLRSLLRPETGWLRQKPLLASRLRPLSYSSMQLVPPELIKRAQTNWDGVCDDAYKYYLDLIQELKPLVRIARDPFIRIEGILNLKNPLEAFNIMSAGMKKSLPDKQLQPGAYHVAVRNCAVVLMICVTGFRINTISQLNYTGDDSGHLFLQNGKFRLAVPRALFKEENSPFFGPSHARADFHMELPKVYGLYWVLEEYLNVSRPWLLNRYHEGRQEQVLFVNGKGSKSITLGSMQIHRIYRSAVIAHLVWNRWRGTGIRGVKPHGPHSARHIRGTAAIKLTGSMQMAADANHNSVLMAKRSYTKYLPSDRTKRVNDTFFPEQDEEDDDEEEPEA